MLLLNNGYFFPKASVQLAKLCEQLIIISGKTTLPNVSLIKYGPIFRKVDYHKKINHTFIEEMMKSVYISGHKSNFNDLSDKLHTCPSQKKISPFLIFKYLLNKRLMIQTKHWNMWFCFVCRAGLHLLRGCEKVSTIIKYFCQHNAHPYWSE